MSVKWSPAISQNFTKTVCLTDNVVFLSTIQFFLWNRPANPMAMGPCSRSLTVTVACTCDTRHYGNNTSMIPAATHATILCVAQLW